MCFAHTFGSGDCAYLVKCESYDGPELSAGHSNEESESVRKDNGVRGTECQGETSSGAFAEISPESLVDVRFWVKGLIHWLSSLLGK